MFKDRLRKIDIEASVKFALAWPIAQAMKPFHKNLWIISERPGEARDNGYVLYKYIRENHPDFRVYYVITKDGIDRKRIDKLGNCLEFYSFKHYVYYWMAKGHASAHVDAGTPNSRVSNFLETHGLLRNKKVYLQHGMIKDLLPFCFYKSTRADLFCCQTKIENDYVKNNFGYPMGNVQQVGLARFDNLLKSKEVKNQIYVMPTWRSWLAQKEYATVEEARTNFKRSSYFKNYNELLANPELHKYLEKSDIKLIFFVHPDMQPYWDMFSTDCARIIIADAKKFDVQELLMTSKVLITDYSSVFFDFAFMNKPVCFFQFDYDEYRSKQHPEGYYDYQDGFGPVLECADDLVKYLQHLTENGYKMDERYQKYTDTFFDLRDGNNCKRIYEAMLKM